MVSTLGTVGKGKLRQRKNNSGFKGVRMRKWGRWVSEIRIPKTRSRIWLGSYDAPEKAARAYDAALYCLRGPRGHYNFPDEKRPEFPDGIPEAMPKTDIKAIAALFSTSPVNIPANVASPHATELTPASASASPTFTMPELPLSDEMDSIYDSAGFPGPDGYWSESFLFVDPITLELENIWDIL
ncbi:integrase-type DNA-binding superfamily protein [Tasmannia lanceolata]|uniref:integrase-type DNA-binding superfamily protein n=1 Tax=Tasmannia lanceolata TaxID=3420 RepID=UPI004064A8A6